jgi:hypothetical protein
LTGYSFNPVNRAVTVNQTTGSAHLQNFIADTYTIEGHTLTSGGEAIAGVKVTADALSTITDATGHYKFADLTVGTYTVVPTLAGYSFNPVERSVTVNDTTGSAHLQNFMGVETGTTSGESYNAAPMGAPRAAPTTPLAAPVLAAPPDGATGLSTSPLLKWQAVAGAAGYVVQVATDECFTNKVFLGFLTDPQDQLNGLSAGGRYYWRVQAYNSDATSPWSQVWSFTTASG